MNSSAQGLDWVFLPPVSVSYITLDILANCPLSFWFPDNLFVLSLLFLSCSLPPLMTQQVQSELFHIPLAFSSPILLNHTLEQPCPQFLFIWCQKHRIGIYDLLSKGLGLSESSCRFDSPEVYERAVGAG